MTRKPIDAMTPEELRAWIVRTKEALSRKMKREQAYLKRRARHGTFTPTDEAYEQDQLFEADLLLMLDEMERFLDGR
jgi:hypothetical protein